MTWCCTCAIEEDLLSGDHGEPRSGGLLGGVAELGPRAALDGPPRAAHLADPRGGGDLDLVALVVDVVLDHLLQAVGVGPDDDRRREEHAEVEVAAIVVEEIAPPLRMLLLLLLMHCRWPSLRAVCCARVLGFLGVRRRFVDRKMFASWDYWVVLKLFVTGRPHVHGGLVAVGLWLRSTKLPYTYVYVASLSKLWEISVLF